MGRPSLGDFLVWDCIRKAEEVGHHAFRETLVRNTEVQAESQRGYELLAALDRPYNAVRRRVVPDRSSRFLFLSRRFPRLVQAADQRGEAGLIVQGMSERLHAMRRFRMYVPIDDLPLYVWRYLQDGDEGRLRRLVERVTEKVGKARPDYVILWNDSLPLARAIVLACRQMDIVSVNVQDGIYTDAGFMHGDAADLVLVWGPHFREMYLKSGRRRPEEVRVLGYPYLLDDRPPGHRNATPIVYYLGQNLEAYREGLLDSKVDTVRALHEACNQVGFRFLYRPHPQENRDVLRRSLPELPVSPPREALSEALQRGDIFVSFSSTSLVEAALRGKLAVQLKNFDIPTEDLEKLGAVARSFDSIAELVGFLQDLVRRPQILDSPPGVDKRYIDSGGDPGDRLLRVLEEFEGEDQ